MAAVGGLMLGAGLRGAETVAVAGLSPSVPSLKGLAATRGLHVGTAVKAGPLESDATYRAMVQRHFGVITPENELKIKRGRPEPDRWDFAAADGIVAFAHEHRLRVRGHTLVWNGDQHAPDWLLALPRERELAARLMREHVSTVMGRYRGRVADWDVVNEAVANDNRPGAAALGRGFWMDAIGENYVAEAFRLAREADPEARLFYNDYDHGLALGPKSQRIYELLRKLKADGVPVHGVGLQLHCRVESPPDRAAMVANFRRLAALGLVVQVTELDVSLLGGTGPREELLARQARIYADVFAAALESKCVETIVMWGFTDRFPQMGLLKRKGLPPQETPMWLFDAEFRPKPAFVAVTHVLRSDAANTRE